MAENETREIFVTGLRNAHAMENQALSIMKPQLERIESYKLISDIGVVIPKKENRRSSDKTKTCG